ncbi:MAG: LPS export ABC transporter periplasmic protein LptC [Candidatus Omnitrophota bacterium]
MMKQKQRTAKFLTAIIAFLLIFSNIDLAIAGETSTESIPQTPKEPIVVNGDNVEYFQEKKMVVGSGNISIKYKDIELTCDKITVYLDTREAIAEGNVKVTQKGAYFTGERMNYNFDTRKGTVLTGHFASNPFYGRAEQLDKVENKDTYKLERGYVTTCDLDNPHYRLQARHVEIYLNDKVVAKHLVLYIRNVPVMYFPYYVQYLKQTKGYVTVMAGKKKEWGYYVLGSYRYHLNQAMKGDAMLDYRTKDGLGLAGGVNNYHDFGKMGKGAFKVYYTKENGRGDDNDHPGEIERRYRYQLRHYWDMGEGTDTVALLEFNKLSDADVIKDYFYNEYEELGNDPDNYLTFITSKPEYTSEFLMRARFNKFQTVVERLPEYKININNMRLFQNIPLYYTGAASGVYLRKLLPADGTVQKATEVGRFDANNKISYTMQFFRTLNVAPFVGTEDTYYSRTLGGETNRIRTVFNAGVETSVKFYKIFDVATNFLGIDINKLRHIITPTANYYYTHQPAIGPEKLTQFDEIDAVDKQSYIAFGFENRLQTKRMSGGQLKSVDLATLLITSDYSFRLKKDNATIYKQRFENLDLQLELIPYDWLYSVSKLSYNTKNSAVQTASIDLDAAITNKWSVGARYDYEKEESGISNLLTADMMYKINDKWRIRAYETISLFKKSVLEQEYTIYRDLHCFVAEMTLRVVPHNDEAGLWFVMRMKAFPQTPIGLKQTYSRPRFGQAVSHTGFTD